MRWDGWMRSGHKSSLIVLAVVILGNLPVLGQEKPAQEKPATAPTTKPAVKPEEKRTAGEMLASAKTAYQQKNYQAAADQFRKLIKTYPSQPETPSARCGLALALAAMPQPNIDAIVENPDTDGGRGVS